MRACALQAAPAGKCAPARVRHSRADDTCRAQPLPAASNRPRRRLRCLASGGDEAADGGVSVEEGRSSLTGEELRELVVAKWGRPYDTRLCQRRNRFNVLTMYLQVMWCVFSLRPPGWLATAAPLTSLPGVRAFRLLRKFQGQKSFPVTAARYAEQLDAVAELLTEWGVVDEAVKGISEATTTPSVDTVGANAVMIPLSVALEDNGNESQ
jgi:hypothetical protein